MTRANTEQLKHAPWFARAGAACSIVPIARFVGPNIFALKGGGYGCLFALAGIDEEGLTDQELDARMRSIEGSLRGLPEGSCLYQYTRVMSGFDLPHQNQYGNPRGYRLRRRPGRYVTDAIVVDGEGKGTIHKVCANPDCPVHYPRKKQQRTNTDASSKAAQDKQRREEAIANAIGVRTLAAIAEAVPVRLMKRDLLFIAERLAALASENHLAALARQYGIKRAKENDSIPKLFLAYLRQSEESVLGSLVVQLALLLAAARGSGAQILREAAAVYKVNTEAISAKVEREFADREKAKGAKKPAPKPAAKATKKA